MSAPRDWLVRSQLRSFGKEADLTWRAAKGPAELAERAQAETQHRAALAVRARLGATKPKMTIGELADALHAKPATLSRHLRGEQRATLAEMFEWAIFFGDANIITPVGALTCWPALPQPRARGLRVVRNPDGRTTRR